MNLTIKVPDEHIDGALAAPASRYWASEAQWDPELRDGFVVERNGRFEGQPERHFLGGTKVRKALLIAYERHPKVFSRIASGDYDADTGDLLLQLMAFGEVRYG